MTVTKGLIGCLPAKRYKLGIERETALVGRIVVIYVGRKVEECGAFGPDVSDTVGYQRRNGKPDRSAAAYKNGGGCAGRARFRPQVVQSYLERSSGETQPVGLAGVIYPGPDGTRFGPDLINMYDRLDRAVTSGQ
jgi:hypothetical protein